MRKKIILVFGSILLILIIVLVSAATYYQINDVSSSLVDEFSVEKCVVNNNCAGTGIFVPTKTSTEWSDFRTNAPSCVEVCDMTIADSDGGQDEETKGTCVVQGSGNCLGNCSTSHTDHCISGDDLREYYISGSTCASVDIDCAVDYSVCEDGECV